MTKREPRSIAVVPGGVVCNGLLFVGDPHVDDVNVPKRLDDHMPAIFRKLEWIVNFANENKLMLVFLGDIFEKHEVENHVLVQMMRILSQCWSTPYTNVGNHDMVLGSTTLSDGDTLMSLHEGTMINAVMKPETHLFNVKGQIVEVGFTPYGHDIPKSVTPNDKAEIVVWVTHHNLAFDGAYPHSQPLTDIPGCNLVVNGHMHKYSDVIEVGNTYWFNPGNINRQSVDCVNHIPTVWEFNPGEGLIPHEVPHVKDVFDMTGHLVSAEEGMIAIREKSVFAELLASSTVQNQDGASILKIIQNKFDKDKTSVEVQNIVLDLLSQVIKK